MNLSTENTQGELLIQDGGGGGGGGGLNHYLSMNLSTENTQGELLIQDGGGGGGGGLNMVLTASEIWGVKPRLALHCSERIREPPPTYMLSWPGRSSTSVNKY